MRYMDRAEGSRQPPYQLGGKLASGSQMTKTILRNFVVASALVGVALATVACPEKGPAEKAGEKIDDAVDKATDTVK
jgi:hypothetical protein